MTSEPFSETGQSDLRGLLAGRGGPLDCRVGAESCHLAVRLRYEPVILICPLMAMLTLSVVPVDELVTV